MLQNPLINALNKNRHHFHPVVPYNPEQDRIFSFDLSASNKNLTADICNNTARFSDYVNELLAKHHCRYAIGGYNEWRSIYTNSDLFGNNGSPRKLHIGLDIWGAVDTPVYAFMGGMVHSFAFNNNDRDYGATLILSHQLEGVSFYTLYGHISLRDIASLQSGAYVNRGNTIGHIGPPEENGNWPPHLHIQLIADLELYEGDYPGVCSREDAEKYLNNCPDPELILNMHASVINT